MKAILQKASARDGEQPKNMEINNLNDIITIMKRGGRDMIHPCELILTLNEDTDTLEVLIYDDYIE